MSNTPSASADKPHLVRVSHGTFGPVAARRDGSQTEQTRSDAVVSVLHEWLHNPGKNQMGGFSGGATPLR